MTIVQHQNVVGALHAGGALGNDKHRHSLGLFVDCLAQGGIGGKVQRRGTVIENQNLRLRHKCAGDGQPLALPAGKIASGGFHRGVQHTGLAAHKIGGLGNFQRLPDGVIIRARSSPLHIVAYRSGEQHRLLRHDAHHTAQLCKAVFLYIVTKQLYAAGVGIIKAGCQVDQRCFAAARAADHAHSLAVLGFKSDIGQAGRTCTAVAEGHAVKRNRRGSFLQGQLGSGGVGHRGPGVQNFIDTHPAGKCPRDRDDQIRQTQQADQNLAHIVDQRNDLPLRQRTGVDLLPTAHQNGNDAKVYHQIGQRVHQSGDTPCLCLDRLQPVIGLHKVCQLIGLACKGTHHAGAHIVFAGQERNAVQMVLGIAVDGHRGAHNSPDDQRDHRRYNQKQHRQPRADGKRHCQRTQHDKRGAQQKAQCQVDAVLHLIDITGHPGDQRRRTDTVQLAVA